MSTLSLYILSISGAIFLVTHTELMAQDAAPLALDTFTLIQDSLSIDTLSIGSTKEFESTESRAGMLYWDASVRLRHEFWNNQEDLNTDLDDLFSFLRLKLHAGGGIRPTRNTELYAHLVTELRYYGHKGTGDSIKNENLYDPQRHFFEIVIGQLYFTWKNIAGTPLSMKIGRQNLHDQGFGEQWLIGDGTPNDGSKTFYYHSARLNYRFNDYTSLDVVGLVNYREDPLVIFSEADRTVTNITDEQGGFIWFKHRIGEQFPYRVYYLYKHEPGGGGFHREESSNIHTAGLHIKPETTHLWLNGQIALQTGTYGEYPRRGIGTMVYGGFQNRTDNWMFRAGPWYTYLSGDKPGTERFEAFNNLYGGYPNDDELYLNTWANESGLSMYTNLNLIGAYLEYTWAQKYNLRFWYHWMLAAEPVTGDFFGEGKSRGHMIMMKAMTEITKRLKAYYMFEYLWTGDFHFVGADNAILSRINFEWYF